MAWLNSLLNLLPFNGQKVKIGAWITGITALYSLLQQVDPEAIKQVLDLLSTSPINWAGVALVLVGLLHKFLKSKYGAIEQPWGK